MLSMLDDNATPGVFTHYSHSRFMYIIYVGYVHVRTANCDQVPPRLAPNYCSPVFVRALASIACSSVDRAVLYPEIFR